MATYFDYLPGDLISSLFYYYSSLELQQIVPELRILPCFKFLYEPIRHKEVWPTIYKRDISSCTDIPVNFSWLNYNEICHNLVTLDGKSLIIYLAENGYDRLLYPRLTNNIEIDNALIHSLCNKHREIAKKVAHLCFNCYVLGHCMVAAAKIGDLEIVELLDIKRRK